jgi:hypothetical protein
MTNPFRYAITTICFAILSSHASALHGVEPTNPESIRSTWQERSIRSAWQERESQLTSFQCTCVLIRTELVSTDAPPDPFIETPPDSGRPVHLKSTFTLSKKGRKIALASEGEVWNDSTKSKINQSYSRCFDGAGNTSLLVGQVLGFPTARLNNEVKPAFGLINNTHYNPLWLAFYPTEFLARLNFDISRMSVSSARSFHQGKDCIELAIPRDELPGDVYVDPSIGYLPVRFVEWRTADRMRSDMVIEYETNPEVGWVISRWKSNLYDNTGVVEVTLSGVVENAAINTPINDDVFTIALPPETRIAETLDGATKYYVQGKDGSRRETPPTPPIDEE